jgi:hypothetical protein
VLVSSNDTYFLTMCYFRAAATYIFASAVH